MAATLQQVAAQTQSTETAVTIGPDPLNPVIQANVDRLAIGFSFSVGGGQVITTNPDPSLASGFIPKSVGIDWLKVGEHGSLVQKAWFARGAGGGNVLTVFEILYNGEG